MDYGWLTILSAVKGFHSDEAVGRPLSEAQQVAAHSVPDIATTWAGETDNEIEGQRSVA